MKKQILLSAMLAAILTIARPALAQENPDRNAYLGELHIHSNWSCDAYVFGTRLGPEDATKYAMGQPVPDSATGKVPPIRSTVDISKGTYQNTTGSKELKTVWTDPDFDPSLDAFYYARALLIPTPRWSTIQAVKLGVVPPEVVPLTVQDRAWSSPIWYTPSAEARKATKPGVPVAELTQKGAVALNDAQLKETIVGKTVNVRNTITGQRFEILYGTGGQRLITAVDGKAPTPEVMGDLMFDPETEYKIQDGHIITTIGGTPFDVIIYKLGDKYLASRSDEYGYANYEVEW